MIVSITIRDINTNKHYSNEYAVAIVYFRGIDETKQEVRADFIKKIHLINELKAKILIETDILISKKFILNFKNNTIVIENCQMTIFITIKRKANAKIDRIVNFKKIILIFSHTMLSIKIHHLNISTKKIFLFESNDVNFSMYVHMIDSRIAIIMIRNEKNISIRIPRNFRLKRTIELNYSNAFQIANDVENLTIKYLKSFHKKS